MFHHPVAYPTVDKQDASKSAFFVLKYVLPLRSFRHFEHISQRLLLWSSQLSLRLEPQQASSVYSWAEKERTESGVHLHLWVHAFGLLPQNGKQSWTLRLERGVKLICTKTFWILYVFIYVASLFNLTLKNKAVVSGQHRVYRNNTDVHVQSLDISPTWW